MNRSVIIATSVAAVLVLISLLALILIKPLKLFISTKIPDTYIHNFNYTAYSKTGKLKCIIKSTRFTHYQKDNISYLKSPKVTFFGPQAPWYITAQHGKTLQQNKIFVLWGHVVIVQSAHGQQPKTTIVTPKVTIYPDQSYAESKQTVTIHQKYTQVHGVGFKAYFNTGKMTLLHQAQGLYHDAKNFNH